MEARLTAVEADVREVKNILGRLEPAIGGLTGKIDRSGEDLSALKGRVSQLPAAVQMVGFVLAVLAAGGLMRHFFP